MATECIGQGAVFANHVHALRGGPSLRGRPLWAAAILAAVFAALLTVGCGYDEGEAIEVAVLYWAHVQTTDSAPVPGRSISFAAARFTGNSRDDSTLQTRVTATVSDGRTYLDARFLLGEGQTIFLAATASAPTSSGSGASATQVISFDQARAREQDQGGRGLASFELTTEFIDDGTNVSVWYDDD